MRLPDSLERSLQSHFHTSSASGHGWYEPLPMLAASTGEQGTTSSHANVESRKQLGLIARASCKHGQWFVPAVPACRLVATVPAVQCVLEQSWLALGL